MTDGLPGRIRAERRTRPGWRVYLLYCQDEWLARQLQRLLAGLAVERAGSMSALTTPPAGACAIVYGLTKCSDADVRRLQSMTAPLSPPCVVVASLSVDCLQRLYPLRSANLRVIWADEAQNRLIDVLEEIGAGALDPLRHLGLKLLSDYDFRLSLREVVGRTCGVHNGLNQTQVVPENSVSRLADHVGLRASTISRYWRDEIPLRCTLKEFLNWAVLLWAVRQRSQQSWIAVANRAGVRRRTLERNSVRLAGCTLSAAAADPERIAGRFGRWIESVWDPGLAGANGSSVSGPVPAEAAQSR